MQHSSGEANVNRHQKRWQVALAAAAAALALGCEGPPGPAGAAGETGATGPAGSQGTQGPAGGPCTVAAVDGGVLVTCPNSPPVLVPDGVAGANGQNCTVTPVDGGVTVSCPGSPPVTIANGADANAVVDFALLTPEEMALLDMNVTVTRVTNVPRPVATFTVKDAKGRPVKNIGPTHFTGISLLQLVPGDLSDGGNGLNIDTWVSHISNCSTCTSSTESATATSLVGDGAGNYTYTFAKDVVNPVAFDGGSAVAGVAFDANAVHRFGLRLAASGNPYRPVDVAWDYVPATGADVSGQNDKVNTNNCLECHMQWRAAANNAGGATPFHAGQRYLTQYCPVCHNAQRKYSGNAISGNAVIAEPTIDGAGNMTPPPLPDGGARSSVPVIRGEAVLALPVWIHKIHRGHELSLKGPYPGLGAELNEIAFPQDLRNCTKCHRNAAKADNYKNKPSRRACGACHDSVDFVTGNGHGPGNAGGPQANDAQCVTCHPATGSLAGILDKHVPVESPDPNNLFDGGASANTHASYVGIRGAPPAGAVQFTYSIPTGGVTTVALADGGLNAVVRFKFLQGDAGVVFNDAGSQELLPNFVGSPSVYCAFAVPQDGLADPADFNATASVYLRNLWRGTATGSVQGPDTGGFYTVTLTGTTIPSTAKMLTCGLGYSYNITSTPPLVQTNLAAYPVTTLADGGVLGGLSIPALNVWQVATGYTGRRGATSSSATAGQVVDPARCNNCHANLGVGPTFHGGQRNNGATCAFCHTPNRASQGWSAGSGSYIHAIHGGGVRSVPFNWRAIAVDEGFFSIKFPGRPQMCEGCHNPGYYDFSNSWYSAANLDRRLLQTVATGTFNNSPLLADGGVNTSAWAISPYVVADGGVSYGSGFSFSATTHVITNAAATTLVNSPIASSCFGCHDSPRHELHFEQNGGAIYEPRSSVGRTELCLFCHGPGKVAGIKAVHYQ